jgi:hypothetical protein
MGEGTRDIGERINTGAASHFPNAVVIGHAPFLLPIPRVRRLMWLYPL